METITLQVPESQVIEWVRQLSPQAKQQVLRALLPDMVDELPEFSDRLELPNIPEGSGVAILEDAQGQVLQVVMSNNIRRRIGVMFDSQGTICVHGPKIYDAQQQGRRIWVRWKHTQGYLEEKRRLVEKLNPLWARG
jgi:hypothetical protein